jgi:Tol biopolymer transport system component
MLVMLLVAVSAGLARGDPVLTGRIAFVSNDGSGDSLYLMDAVGSPAWRVPGVPVVRTGTLQYPQWSQDGQWLTFCTELGAFTDIRAYVVRPDGTGFSQVPSPAQAYSSSLSPDASAIAFNSGWDERLYTQNLDGTNRVEYGLRWTAFPRFCPDGKSVVHCYGGVYDFDLLTRTDTLIVGDPSSYKHFMMASWSPDAKRLAMEAVDYSGGPTEIWTVNRDGSGLVNLGAGGAPAWTSDGQHIVFSLDYDLWSVDADGRNRINLTNTPGINETMPAAAVTPVPEPVSLASGAIGLACVGAYLRRRIGLR